MKKIFICLFLVLVFSLGGCTTKKIEDFYTPPIDPPMEEFPDNDTPNAEDFEEEKKRKQYLVSKTNSLRIRSTPSSSGTVLGYLDKDDALQITGETGEYYRSVFKEKQAYVSKKYCSVMEIEYENDDIERAIDLGSSLLGYPYVWGSERYHWGNGILNKNYVHGEYDCSAFVQYIYYQTNGVLLDVTSRKQSLNGTDVDRKELKRGDLMFFTNASRINKTGIERIGHVGIYFGNNYILHTASDHAVIEPISATRWSYYISAKRVV
ncbi:MAG: NlpC/P60 family protein [Clostridiales bacterium]|nr:NlpC/P60 family protein [Clostridiales bacterium]